jgi:hypothetical protein
MKNKVMILIISVILIIGGISVAYASGINDKSFNNIRKPMMSTQNGEIQSNDKNNNMIKIMKDNGFNDEANAMNNKDFDYMNKLMTNMSGTDYKKMIDIMQKNGYGYMANMMKSISQGGITNTYQGMMGR